jgi:predicted acylesterase/phospholipase RssA
MSSLLATLLAALVFLVPGAALAQSRGETPPRVELPPRAPLRALGTPDQKTCLVLSASAGLGLAHVGVIRALQESNVRIDCVVGTGVGAVVGAAYAGAPNVAIDDAMGALVREFSAMVEENDATRGVAELAFAEALSGGLDRARATAEREVPRRIGYLRYVRSLALYFSRGSIERLTVPLVVLTRRAHEGAAFEAHRDGDIAEFVALSSASASRFSNFDPAAQNIGDVASVTPIDEACRLFPDARLLVSNAGGVEAESAETTTCPKLIAMTQEADLARPENRGLVEEAGYNSAVRAFGAGLAAAHFFRVRSALTMPGASPLSGSGTMDSAIVDRMLTARQAQLRACHERILRDDPTLEATFTIDFTIFPDRSVSGFSSPPAGEGAAELQACVQGILAQIPFARGPANGSVTFSVPFQFAVQR